MRRPDDAEDSLLIASLIACLQATRFSLEAKKFARCEHLKTVNRLAQEFAEVTPVECQQHIGAGECAKQHRLVFA